MLSQCWVHLVKYIVCSHWWVNFGSNYCCGHIVGLNWPWKILCCCCWGTFRASRQWLAPASTGSPWPPTSLYASEKPKIDKAFKLERQAVVLFNDFLIDTEFFPLIFLLTLVRYIWWFLQEQVNSWSWAILLWFFIFWFIFPYLFYIQLIIKRVMVWCVHLIRCLHELFYGKWSFSGSCVRGSLVGDVQCCPVLFLVYSMG
jgi:hypothetical protein